MAVYSKNASLVTFFFQIEDIMADRPQKAISSIWKKLGLGELVMTSIWKNSLIFSILVARDLWNQKAMAFYKAKGFEQQAQPATRTRRQRFALSMWTTMSKETWWYLYSFSHSILQA